jgi:hypothetical protein
MKDTEEDNPKKIEEGLGKLGWTIIIIVALFYEVMFIWIVLDLSGNGYHSGYKQGQIDYATGKIQYALKLQADNSVIWEKK